MTYRWRSVLGCATVCVLPGARREDQHVQLLVIALPDLVAMIGLPVHVQPVRPDPRLPGSDRCALGRPQLAHERALQRPQTRQHPSRSVSSRCTAATFPCQRTYSRYSVWSITRDGSRPTPEPAASQRRNDRGEHPSSSAAARTTRWGGIPSRSRCVRRSASASSRASVQTSLSAGDCGRVRSSPQRHATAHGAAR